jgi:hypothetical protein
MYLISQLFIIHCFLHFHLLVLDCRAQAHFIPFTARDEALSMSLNSDYLGQVMISADSARMDRTLVEPYVAERGLSDESTTMLIQKRG